jgi:hypothetical protein
MIPRAARNPKINVAAVLICFGFIEMIDSYSSVKQS